MQLDSPFPLSSIFSLACTLSSLMCDFLVALRTYFIYEAGKREGLEEQMPLLLDMVLLTACIFLQA